MEAEGGAQGTQGSSTKCTRRYSVSPLSRLTRGTHRHTHKHTHKTLGRSLGSHDATELVGGMCHGSGCQHKTTRLYAISCTKTGWSSLTHNRVLHQALARSLRESKVQFVVEDTWPFRERASKQNGRLNPLRMDTTAEAGDSSTTTLVSRIRHFYSTLQSSTLAPAPIWGMQHAM